MLTVPEAARLLGVTPAAVYARIQKKQLTSQLLFGRCVVPRLAIEEWQRDKAAEATKRARR